MEGAPKSVESNESLEGKVKSLENKIKGLKWSKRIAYMLAFVGGLSFAVEKIDDAGDKNAIDDARVGLKRIDGMLSALDKSERSEEGGNTTDAGIYRTIWNPDEIVKEARKEAESLGKLLNETDRSQFEKLTESPEYLEK